VSHLLAIDVGNTHTTLGLYKGSELIYKWRLSTKVERTNDELWLLLLQSLNSVNLSFDAIDRIGISSVVPALTATYAAIARDRWEKDPVIVSAKTSKKIRMDYHPPEAVGADRICNAVAGFEKFGGPLIIIDLGTATVFDVVSKDGVYEGGLIAPGIATAAESLHRMTAMLPMVELKFPQTVVGKTTEQSIQSGIVYGAVEMIDGMVRRIQNTLSSHAKVIATGGFASMLKPGSETIEHVEPDLVLEGIRLIVEVS
jgi:type III pantothenate kinase